MRMPQDIHNPKSPKRMRRALPCPRTADCRLTAVSPPLLCLACGAPGATPPTCFVRCAHMLLDTDLIKPTTQIFCLLPGLWPPPARHRLL